MPKAPIRTSIRLDGLLQTLTAKRQRRLHLRSRVPPFSIRRLPQLFGTRTQQGISTPSLFVQTASRIFPHDLVPARHHAWHFNRAGASQSVACPQHGGLTRIFDQTYYRAVYVKVFMESSKDLYPKEVPTTMKLYFTLNINL